MMQRDFWKISAVVFCLAFALVLAGCGGTSSPADPPPPITDPALNGTWVHTGGQVLTFYNGSFEMIGFQKGNFTTSSGTLTLEVTHLHGIALAGLGYEKFEGQGWIPRAELIAGDNRFTEENFVSETVTYKVEGDTLTITDVSTTIWTRQ